VKQDANGLGGGGDPSWDPVWEVQTNIDSLGWTAEMRIPFSQLRYPETSAEQTWGLPDLAAGESHQRALAVGRGGGRMRWGAARFGHLHGVVIRHAPGRAEVMPYLVGRSSNVPGDQADPFFDPHASMARRRRRDAAGHVESHPGMRRSTRTSARSKSTGSRESLRVRDILRREAAVLRRGGGYFGLGGFSCFFCSKRVEPVDARHTAYRTPAAGLPFARGLAVPVEYADMPENSTILGAAKLTGRTQSGGPLAPQ